MYITPIIYCIGCTKPHGVLRAPQNRPITLRETSFERLFSGQALWPKKQGSYHNEFGPLSGL